MALVSFLITTGAASPWLPKMVTPQMSPKGGETLMDPSCHSHVGQKAVKPTVQLVFWRIPLKLLSCPAIYLNPKFDLPFDLITFLKLP